MQLSALVFMIPRGALTRSRHKVESTPARTTRTTATRFFACSTIRLRAGIFGRGKQTFTGLPGAGLTESPRRALREAHSDVNITGVGVTQLSARSPVSR